MTNRLFQAKGSVVILAESLPDNPGTLSTFRNNVVDRLASWTRFATTGWLIGVIVKGIKFFIKGIDCGVGYTVKTRANISRDKGKL